MLRQEIGGGLNCWWCDSKDSAANNPQVLHSPEMHRLHMSRDTPLASTDKEIAKDFVLEWGEPTVQASERIDGATFAFVRKVERQRVTGSKYKDPVDSGSVGHEVMAMYPSAVASLR
jgi:hypothetical protein